MEPKKISFGFSKLMKKSNIVINKEPVKTTENKVQLIDCLEEKSIKVVGGDESINKGPLVIPMKQPNKKLVNLVDLVKNNFVETVEETNGNVQTESNKTTNEINTSQLSLEEQAALELLNASKKKEIKDDNKRIIEIDKDKFVAEGEKESSLDDYESVPIEEFGKAILRGMGWKDGCGIGKNEKLVKVVQPAIRPKGMGLGADKITKQDPNNKPAVDKDGQVLKCVKRAYVKIIAGYHKGSYGQIMGLDDESGRFIIKTAINNLNISLNEFLVVPVTKEEYNKSSKIINNAKYEEYMKKKEEEEKRTSEKGKSKKYESEDEDYKKKKSRVKKERKSESSDTEEATSKREEKKKTRVKKERKSDSSDAEEGTSRRPNKNKNEKIKKEHYSDDSDEDTYKTKRKEDKYKRKDDYEDRKYKQKYYDDDVKDRKNKYDTDEEYKRDRKYRSEKKSKKHASDVSESEDEDEKKYKKSSKRDEDYNYSKKKNKKKKSKKYSSDESDDDRYKRKSKKSDKKYHSDSENEEKRSKSHKRDKKDRSRYDR